MRPADMRIGTRLAVSFSSIALIVLAASGFLIADTLRLVELTRGVELLTEEDFGSSRG